MTLPSAVERCVERAIAVVAGQGEVVVAAVESIPGDYDLAIALDGHSVSPVVELRIGVVTLPSPSKEVSSEPLLL